MVDIKIQCCVRWVGGPSRDEHISQRRGYVCGEGGGDQVRVGMNVEVSVGARISAGLWGLVEVSVEVSCMDGVGSLNHELVRDQGIVDMSVFKVNKDVSIQQIGDAKASGYYPQSNQR